MILKMTTQHYTTLWCLCENSQFQTWYLRLCVRFGQILK